MLESKDYVDILVALTTSIENYKNSQITSKMYSNEFYTRKINELQCLYERVHKAFMEC